MRFLDTNIFLRHLTRDDEAKAQAARALFHRIARGEESVLTSPLVIFEVVFTLERTYKVAKSDVAKLLLPILRARGLKLANKGLFREAFAIHITYPIEFADAYNIAFMQNRGITDVYTWDEGFDKVPGIRRVEP